MIFYNNSCKKELTEDYCKRQKYTKSDEKLFHLYLDEDAKKTKCRDPTPEEKIFYVPKMVFIIMKRMIFVHVLMDLNKEMEFVCLLKQKKFAFQKILHIQILPHLNYQILMMIYLVLK